MFHSKIATCLLALSSLASAAAIKEKRDTLDVTLYAYGTNITGHRIFFIDNFAYIGDAAPDFANVAANITLSTDPSDSTSPWTTISNSTATNSTLVDGRFLYIITTAGSTAPVGFASSTDNLPEGAAYTGFTWFGTTVAYIADETDFEMKFWAVPTNATDLYSLVWNVDGASISGGTPVALKSTGPVVLDLTKRMYNQ